MGRREPMRFASIAELKDGLSEYLVRARKKGEPIIVIRHGKPYALILPLEGEDLEELDWKRLAGGRRGGARRGASAVRGRERTRPSTITSRRARGPLEPRP